MKNSFIISNIRKALPRQLIFPALLLMFSLTVFVKTPKDNILNPRPLNYKSSYENSYNYNLPHVAVTVSGLKYSGLDYVVDGHIRGYYYYTLINEFCQFYILNKETGTPPAPELSTLNLRGRLIQMADAEYDSIVQNMASGLNWTAASMKNMASPYAVSTIPHPIYFNLTFYGFLLMCILISVWDILSAALCFYEPLRSPAFRYLGMQGESRLLLPSVEAEIKYYVTAKNGNIYLTPNYIICLEADRSILLPLTSVSRIYSRSSCSYIRHHIPALDKYLKPSCTLCIRTKDGRTYAFPHRKKEKLNAFMTAVKLNRPDVSLGLSEKKKMALD